MNSYRHLWQRSSRTLISLVLSLSASSLAFSGATEVAQETAIVEQVSDGDTIYVTLIDGPDMGFADNFCQGTDGQGHPTNCLVRLIGYNSTERADHTESGKADCGSDEAAAVLESKIPPGTEVILKAQSVSSHDPVNSGGRLVRSVYLADGVTNVGKSVITSGYGLWFPLNKADTNKPEYSHNLEYRKSVKYAMDNKRGFWKTTGLCGTKKTANVSLYVVSDPEGADTPLNEIIYIRNNAATDLSISGWVIRDSSLITYKFPTGAKILAGKYIRVYPGQGTNTSTSFYMGGTKTIFSNVVGNEGYYFGDSVYLFESTSLNLNHGNLQASFHYPCITGSCVNSLSGKLALGTIMYDPAGTDTASNEYINIINKTSSPISLLGLMIRRQTSTYAFPPYAVVPANSFSRLYIGKGTNTTRTYYMGRDSSLLGNTGDRIQLLGLDASTVHCKAWGSFTCPTP